MTVEEAIKSYNHFADKDGWIDKDLMDIYNILVDGENQEYERFLYNCTLYFDVEEHPDKEGVWRILGDNSIVKQ